MHHLNRISDALQNYAMRNKQPAVDEPADDFERYINEWYELQSLIAELKQLLKPAELEERKMRDGIAESIRTFMGDAIKEGVNVYELSNMRKLKFSNKVSRDIDPAGVAAAREAYTKATGQNGQAFDALLRVKYELDKRNWTKIEGEAHAAFSKCLTTKHAAPTLEVD